MKRNLFEILKCPKAMTLGMAFIAAAALSMALASQYWGGLQPCILCLYQRWPYGIVIALGLLGFIGSFLDKKWAVFSLALIGPVYFINSAIAFYHTGVERKWWPSHLDGCAVPDLGDDPTAILEKLEKTQAVRCDEIPWNDPVLGLSMANYNVMFCLALGIIALIAARKITKA